MTKSTGKLPPRDPAKFARELLRVAFPEMCRAFVAKAKKGDASALRVLWRMAGGEPVGAGDGGRALARKMLREMK